ncbi:CynX/NimT family MFS transporter [Mycolicibacterium parafortuitum]|uniref:MFS transporter CP family, cyanate transporter [Amycolatopsis mediterranei S699] n=1 Tax=Mycolicibacterium parafortuitum TaxID=39692 RepID=A0A375YG06_MYCPF|nr:MFS transporter [Mycolicibacterium parafortuitum]ORB28878.1 MFS transporter [Mycolicibacterium parafortuitum]SRX80004.1 MFS transporter CP family, cyanate transporter [Amycolatopsis mediterranei S699] [Mycolicibacterium parafortuitum]
MRTPRQDIREPRIGDTAPAPNRGTAGVLLAVAVVLTALNLRPAVTSIATVLGDIRTEMSTSATWAGLLTTVPALCFAAAGLAAPWIASRIGLGRTISVSMVALTAGLALRVAGGPQLVIGATLIACAGIALANVLIPVVIKGSFPARIGLMTGIYTAALQGGGALGSALTPGLLDPLGGWREALAIWALVSFLALALWIPASRSHRGAWAAHTRRTAGRRSLLRSPLAWTVTLFFGTQSFMAYIAMGWLPEVFIDNGIDKVHAGLLVGLMSLVGVPLSLFIAPMAARRPSQSGWILAVGLFGVAGTIGMMVAPAAQPLLWSVLIGIGMSAFSMALAVLGLRARTPEDTGQLSGMAQGLGYLFAGTGPFLFGLLHDVSHGWTVPWIMYLGVYVVQIVAGVLAGRARYV